MKYFLDSAKLNEIQYARDNWGIAGVTTNPAKILDSGMTLRDFTVGIRHMIDGSPDFPILVEIDPHLDTTEAMLDAARELAALSSNFIIKLPCCESGISAGYRLSKEGIRFAMTLVFNAAQAIAAANIGASCVAPFIGWTDEIGGSGAALLEEIGEIYTAQGYKTEIIAAAVRNPRQIADAALAGCHIMTCGFEVMRKSFSHPMTDVGLGKFRAAWDQSERTSK